MSILQSKLRIDKSKICYVHRGRNHLLTKYFIPQIGHDYNFDFRGTPFLNSLFLVLKSFLNSIEIRRSEFFLFEGGMHIPSAIFLKWFYPQSKFILNIADPTLFLKNTTFLSRFKFKFKLYLISRFDFLITNSPMIKQNLNILFPQKKNVTYRYYLPLFYECNFDFNNIKIGTKGTSVVNIGFSISRPAETGFVKGFDIFFKILDYLSYKLPENTNFYLCGKNTEKYLNKKNLINLGHVTDIKFLFNKIDILLCTSRYDSYPSIVIEALNNNVLPIVSSKCGNSLDLKKINPKLVIENPENIDEWLYSIKYFMNNALSKNSLIKINNLLTKFIFIE